MYRALRERINLFETVVGRLQPILARLPRAIAENVLVRREDRDANRGRVLEAVTEQARESGTGGGFELNEVLTEGLTIPRRSESPVTLESLDHVKISADLMPQGTEIQTLGRREYAPLAPGMGREIRVTTDAQYYDEHAENVELRTPGSPAFYVPEFTASVRTEKVGERLDDILDS